MDQKEIASDNPVRNNGWKITSGLLASLILLLFAIIIWLASAFFALIIFLRSSPFPESDVREFQAALNGAKSGSADAQFNLGYCYDWGIGTETNLKAAAEWYSKASDNGHILAKTYLGQKYLSGDGVKQDLLSGVALIKDSADAYEALAEIQLAKLYESGIGIERNPEQSAVWYANADYFANWSPFESQITNECLPKLESFRNTLTKEQQSEVDDEVLRFRAGFFGKPDESLRLNFKVPNKSEPEPPLPFMVRNAGWCSLVLIFVGFAVLDKALNVRYSEKWSITLGQPLIGMVFLGVAVLIAAIIFACSERYSFSHYQGTTTVYDHWTGEVTTK